MNQEIKKPRPIFERPNVVVAGGAGFIGSWLCEELAKANKVICIDDFSTGSVANVEFLLQDPNFKFINWDLSKPLDLESLPELDFFQLKFQGVQEIYNLACPTVVVDFERYMVQTARANALVTLNLLEMAEKYGAKFLQASSASVYGIPAQEGVSIKESDFGKADPLAARAAYDEGKRFAEAAVAAYARTRGVDARIARLFNVYGPRMAAGTGRMIPEFIEAALDGLPLAVPADGAVGTYCYAQDAVEGLRRAMAAPAVADEVEAYNVGSPLAVPVADVARRIVALVGSDSTLVPAEEAAVPMPIASIAKAKAALDWFPLVPLESGLQATIEYVVSHRGLLRSGS